MIVLLALLALARADDAWSRPTHLRAVAEAPRAWRELDRPRRVRLWWDEVGAGAEIQEERRGTWVTVARDAAPGWTSPPREVEARFRVRLSLDARWSDPVGPVPWWGPSDLAQVAGPPGAVLALVVGQVQADPQGTGAWISTLGGGLAHLSSLAGVGRADSLTRWDGLPDDRVIAVHALGREVLAGTARGAALLRDGVVVRVWDEELPDPYVQAVLVEARRDEGLRYWAGTYHGLARIQEGVVETVLSPWSVFSLAQAAGGGVWAGYEGLRRVVEDAPPAGDEDGASSLVAGEQVYQVLDLAGQVFVASRDGGLGRLGAEGASVEGVAGYPDSDAYGVAAGPGGLWVASGDLGLIGPGGRAWGRAQGLPADSTWTVGTSPDGALWLGTSRGPALVRLQPDGGGDRPRAVVPFPRARWPAGTEVWDLELRPDGAWLAGPAGIWPVGRPHRHADDLVVAAGDRVVGVVLHGKDTWTFGRRAVRLDRRGRLAQVELPFSPRTAVSWAGDLWVAGEPGIWRYAPETDRFVPVVDLRDVERLVPGRLALWAVGRGAVFLVVAGGARPFLQTHHALDVAPVEKGAWVGTTDGLEFLVLEGEGYGDALDVLGEGDAGVAVPAVAADAAGGCWFAAEDGTVGRVFAGGRKASVVLGEPDPPRPNAIVVEDEQTAWVLTAEGAWRVRIP